MPMSPRRQVAEKIAQKIRDLELCTPVGGDLARTRSGGRRPFYCVGFSKPANLDGTVSIYGHRLILVEYLTRYTVVAHRDRHVFKKVDDVTEFLQAAFVNFDRTKVEQIIARGMDR
jgi:hypothetical protein